MSDAIPLGEAALESRVNLAIDILLTSGAVLAEDVERGWWDAPDPNDEFQRTTILVALTVICGGVDGAASVDELNAAWKTPRLLQAAIRAVLQAVETVRAERGGAE